MVPIPEDPARAVEQQALRNVRTLVDELEGQDQAVRGRQWWWMLLIVLPIGLFGAFVAMKQIPATADPAVRKLQVCEVDALVVRIAEFERVTREANPTLSYKEIGKLLEKERPTLAAAATAECKSKGK